MKETEKIREQDIAQVKVTLKPIFGMRPRVYVPILYVLALLVVLFFVLVNPGLRKPGAHLVFEGNPESAAVYLDGSYAGNTLDGFYAKPGPHELEIRKRGFSSQTFKVEVPRRIFATLIFRPRVKLAYELSPESLEAIMVPSFKEFANWSFSGKPSAIYQLPMVLSEAAADAASTPFPDRSALAVPLLAAGLSVAAHRAGAQRRFSPWQLQKLRRSGDGDHPRKGDRHHPSFPHRAQTGSVRSEDSSGSIVRHSVRRPALIHHVCRWSAEDREQYAGRNPHLLSSRSAGIRTSGHRGDRAPIRPLP